MTFCCLVWKQKQQFDSFLQLFYQGVVVHSCETKISNVEKAGMSSIHEVDAEWNVKRSLNDDDENKIFETMSFAEDQQLSYSQKILESPGKSPTPKRAIPCVIEINDSPTKASSSLMTRWTVGKIVVYNLPCGGKLLYLFISLWDANWEGIFVTLLYIFLPLYLFN